MFDFSRLLYNLYIMLSTLKSLLKMSILMGTLYLLPYFQKSYGNAAYLGFILHIFAVGLFSSPVGYLQVSRVRPGCFGELQTQRLNSLTLCSTSRLNSVPPGVRSGSPPKVIIQGR